MLTVTVTQVHYIMSITAQDRFTVYETNADYEPLRSVYNGESLDIAETLAVKVFKQHAFEKDFMVVNMTKRDVVSVILSERTKRIRGECSQ